MTAAPPAGPQAIADLGQAALDQRPAHRARSYGPTAHGAATVWQRHASRCEIRLWTRRLGAITDGYWDTGTAPGIRHVRRRPAARSWRPWTPATLPTVRPEPPAAMWFVEAGRHDSLWPTRATWYLEDGTVAARRRCPAARPAARLPRPPPADGWRPVDPAGQSRPRRCPLPGAGVGVGGAAVRASVARRAGASATSATCAGWRRGRRRWAPACSCINPLHAAGPGASPAAEPVLPGQPAVAQPALPARRRRCPAPPTRRRARPARRRRPGPQRTPADRPRRRRSASSCDALERLFAAFDAGGTRPRRVRPRGRRRAGHRTLRRSRSTARWPSAHGAGWTPWPTELPPPGVGRRRRLRRAPSATACGSTSGASGSSTCSWRRPAAAACDADGRPRRRLRLRTAPTPGAAGPARAGLPRRRAARHVQPDGQDWGLPPFVPWKLRAAATSRSSRPCGPRCAHCGGIRIDHVMGLFRLYWIPPGGWPADGAYVRYPHDELLDLLALEAQRAGAFVVGEDLGTVEDEVRDDLAERGSPRRTGCSGSRRAAEPERFPVQALAARHHPRPADHRRGVDGRRPRPTAAPRPDRATAATTGRFRSTASTGDRPRRRRLDRRGHRGRPRGAGRGAVARRRGDPGRRRRA